MRTDQPSLRECDRTRLHYDTKREAAKAARRMGKDYAAPVKCRCHRWRVVLQRDLAAERTRELQVIGETIG